MQLYKTEDATPPPRRASPSCRRGRTWPGTLASPSAAATSTTASVPVPAREERTVATSVLRQRSGPPPPSILENQSARNQQDRSNDNLVINKNPYTCVYIFLRKNNFLVVLFV
jgi:hypothetical protein